MNNPNINELRATLMATLADLRNREQPMEIDRARAVAQVAGVLVDTAKVEVEYIKACGGSNTSAFIEHADSKPALPTDARGANNPFQLANQNH